MELGLQFDWEQSKEAIALISLGGKGEGNFSLVQSLVSEASVRYPQLNQLRFVHVPLPVSRLESWSYYLAAQVTAQWRELPMQDLSVQIIVDRLGLGLVGTRELSAALDKIGTSLTLQLAKRVELLGQQQQKFASYQKQWLQLEATKLAQWFTGLPATPSGSSRSSVEAKGCLAQLQSNVLALRAKLLRQLRDCFAQTQQIGPRSLLSWLASLIKTFDSIRADYEVQRQDNLRRESSAWRAYYHLNSLLEQRRWGLFGQERSDWEAALSALACAYKFKLQAEIYTQSAQLVGELAQQTRLYADSVEQLDAKLASLQNYFTSRGLVEPLFLPFLQHFLSKQFNSTHLRSELESWMGFPFNQWSILESTQTTDLGEQILARMRPLCLEVYAECCRCVLNLESPSYQTSTMRTQTPASTDLSTMLSDSEKRVSLQVDKADIQYVLEQLAKIGQVCVIADKSITGKVSLVLDEVPLTEAMDAVAAACKLTYTKSSSIYTFDQTPDSPATIIPEPSVTSPAVN